MSFDSNQILAYLPMLILIGMGCVILLAETFATPASPRGGLAWLGIGGCVASVGALVSQWGDAGQVTTHFQGMLVVDRVALYLDASFLAAALLTLLFAPPF